MLLAFASWGLICPTPGQPPTMVPMTEASKTELRFPRSTSLRIRELQALDERLANHQEYQRADLAGKQRLVRRMRLPFQVSVVVSSGAGGVLFMVGLRLLLRATLELIGGGNDWGALLAGLGAVSGGLLTGYFAINAGLHLRLYGALLGELELAGARGAEPRSLGAALEDAQTSHGTTGPPRAPGAQVAVRVPDLVASHADVARVDAHLERITTMRNLDAQQRRTRLLRQVPAMRSGALGLGFAVGMFIPSFATGGFDPIWLALLQLLGVIGLGLLMYIAWSSWRFAALLEVALFEADAAAHEERPVRPLTTLGRAFVSTGIPVN